MILMNMGTIEDWEGWFPSTLGFLTFSLRRMILAAWSKACAGVTGCNIACFCQTFRELHNVKTILDHIWSTAPLLSAICLSNLAQLSWKACSPSSSCPSHINSAITGKQIINHVQNFQTDRRIRFFFFFRGLERSYLEGHHSYSISRNIHNWIWTSLFNGPLFFFVPAKDYLYEDSGIIKQLGQIQSLFTNLKKS